MSEKEALVHVNSYCSYLVIYVVSINNLFLYIYFAEAEKLEGCASKCKNNNDYC